MLELRKSKLGPDHPDTLTSMSNLAFGYSQSGQTEQALELDREVLELRRTKLGLDHTDTLTSMANLAASYSRVRKLDKSVPLFEEVIKIQSKKLGHAHPNTQLSVANLGVNYKDAGRVDEAIPLLEEAFESSKRIKSLQWVSKPLRDAYIKGKRIEKLKGLVFASIEKSRATGKPKTLRTEISQGGYDLFQVGAYTDAEKLLQESYNLHATYNADSWEKFDVQSKLGAAMLKQEKFAIAKTTLAEAYDGLSDKIEQVPDDQRERILLRVVNWLIELAEATENEEDLKKWTAEKEKLAKESSEQEDSQ